MVAEKVKNKELIQLLNDGMVATISRDEVHVRLYSVPLLGRCLKKKITVCAHRYYIAARSIEKVADFGAFELGVFGEIRNIRKFKSSGKNVQRFRWDALNWPTKILNSRRDFDVVATEYEAIIHPHSVDVTEIGPVKNPNRKKKKKKARPKDTWDPAPSQIGR